MNLIESVSEERIENAMQKMLQIELPIFDGNITVDKYIAQITKTIKDEFGFLPHVCRPMKQNTFNLPIYRVREVESISNIDLFSEHSYPPSNLVGMGRCNFPNYPVFYAATDPSVAILEVLRSTPSSKEYCISIWDVSQTNDDFIFQSFLNVLLPKENVFAVIHKDMKSKLNQNIFNGNLSENQQDALDRCLTYLDSQFILDESYSISATLAHRCLYMDYSLRTDILMYPSVQSKMKGVNLAIAPNFVDNNMQIKRLYNIKVNNFDLDKNTLNLDVLKIGIIQKNVILWHEFNMNNSEHAALIVEDFKNFSPIKKELNS